MSALTRVRARWSTSLQAQAMAANFLPMLAATCAILSLFGFLFFVQVNSFENELRLRAQSLADSLSMESELGIMVGDTARLEHIAKAVKSVDGVLYVTIDNASGERLVTAAEPAPPDGKSPEHSDVVNAPATPLVEAVSRVRASASAPLLDWEENNGRAPVLGTVRVGLSSEKYHALYWHSVWSMVAVAGLSLMLTLTVQHRQLRRVLAPLKDLIVFTRQVAQGNLNGCAAIVRRDEVGQLAAACNDMVRELDRSRRELIGALDAAHEASRLKSQFLANMSHEIRTPLNGVIGMTEIALDSATGAETREQLSTALTSAQTLLGVLNDILDLSKIEAGKLELDSVAFNIESVVEQVVRTFAVQANRKGIELICTIPADVPRWVTGDPDRLRQVLSNLVSNALKFTEEGEVVVSVSASSSAERVTVGDRLDLAFTVRDTGIGIPAEKHESIFEAFTQVDGSMTRQHGGTGLGLTICARLADLMGGSIELASRPGAGSTFRFAVALARAATPDHTTALFNPSELVGLRVLVVDDNLTSRVALRKTLEDCSVRVECADSGAAALSASEAALRSAKPFRVVVLDASMPEMDGFETGRRLRARFGGQPLSFVVLNSGAAGPQPARRDLEDARTITKPVSRSELLHAIASAAGRLTDRTFLRQVDEEAGSGEGRCLSILIAEDNRVNQRVLQGMLGKAGHAVTVASDGLEAIAQHARQSFDLILMDVQMPGMSGWEATRRIRSAESGLGTRTPIIALTAHALPGDRDMCFEAGMDAYLSKPVTRAELFEAIASSSGLTRATMCAASGG